MTDVKIINVTPINKSVETMIAGARREPPSQADRDAAIERARAAGKRFFEYSDGCAAYVFVARSLEDAQKILADAGIVDPAAPEDYKDYEWRERPKGGGQTFHTDDERGVVFMADLDFGDWGCNEF